MSAYVKMERGGYMLRQSIHGVSILSTMTAFLLGAGITPALGSGFGIFTQGATALGQGNAVTANTTGPSTTYFNPALLTRLPGTRMEVGTTLIIPDREFSSSATGETTKTTDDLFFPSTFYASHRISEQWAVGLGVFSPFGLATTWPDAWEGRYAATESSLSTIAINPSVAWQPLPGVSVAAGLDILYLDAELNSRVIIPVAPGPPPVFVEVPQRLKADGTAASYNLALAVDLTKGLTFGAAYREEYKVDIEGDMTVGPLAANANTTVTLPRQLAAGLAYDTGSGLTVEAGVRWEDWSSTRHLDISLDQPPGTVVVPRDWSDTFAWNVGGRYRLTDKLSVMAGYLYGENPVPDSTFEPAIPDSDSHLFCLGSEFNNGGLTFAVSYGLQLQESRSSQSYPAGSYESMLHLVGMSVGYRF